MMKLRDRKGAQVVEDDEENDDAGRKKRARVTRKEGGSKRKKNNEEEEDVTKEKQDADELPDPAAPAGSRMRSTSSPTSTRSSS